MRQFPFRQVDVFTAEPHRGNPLAVVHDATGLDDDAMAAFARWTNLSETVFLLPPVDPGADYRLRIFTPGGELPFAGHPTLGACYCWLAAGGRSRQAGCVVQECGAGLVRVRTRGDRLAFAAPPLLRTGPVADDDLAVLLPSLGLAPGAVEAHQWVDNGPGWCALLLRSVDALRALAPDWAALGDYRVGVAALLPATEDGDLEVRAFVPGVGVPEDPVTGSLNAGIGQWLIGEGRLPPVYRARQGRSLARDGWIEVAREEDALWVGGQVVEVVAGSVAFPS
jgi:PhzF family phenazine biosynthesis protein